MSPNFRSEASEDIFSVYQCRRSVLNLCVSACGFPIPRFIYRLVFVETGDEAIKQAGAICSRQAKYLNLKCF